MVLKEYASIIAPMIPSPAFHVAMDPEAIRIFIDRPQLVTSTKRKTWVGNKCVGYMRYWDGFLDKGELMDEDGRIEWTIACEHLRIPGAREPMPLGSWLLLLDTIMPLEFSAGTMKGSRMSLWKRPPKLVDGIWQGAGGQKPVAEFYCPYALVSDIPEARETHIALI